MRRRGRGTEKGRERMRRSKRKRKRIWKAPLCTLRRRELTAHYSTWDWRDGVYFVYPFMDTSSEPGSGGIWGWTFRQLCI
jgi:hypothetical protein